MTAGTTTGGTDTRDMLVVHTALRREFRLAPGLVRGVAAGDRERAEVVGAHLAWLLDVLHRHHEVEDRLLWPVLLERAPTELTAGVRLMAEQHARIGNALAQVETLLPVWRAQADRARGEALATALDDVERLLVEHLAAEEREMLPLAGKTLTQAEWDRLGEDAMSGLSKKEAPLAIGLVMYEGDPAVIRNILAHAPLLARLLMPYLAPAAYRRYARKVHGTATP